MRAIAAALLTFSAASHAQIPNIVQRGRQVIQQPPAQQPSSRQGNPGSSGPAPGQCQALVQWIGNLQREDPKIDFLHTSMGPKLYDQVINLYRDESFVPLYGRPFSQTTPEERLAFHRSVFRGCLAPAGQLSQAEQTMLRQYETLVDRPFLFPRTAEFSAEFVVAGLAQRQTILAWMQQVSQNLAQVPATPQGFDELQNDMKRGPTDLDKLWPREKEAFLKAIADRQSVLARAILDTVTVTAKAEAAKGFAGVKAINNLYSGQERYLKLLDPESKVQVQKQKDQAIAAAVQAAIPGEKQKLAALPAGLAGASAIADWEHTFKAETHGLPTSPDAEALVVDTEQRRKKLLAGGLPEFKTLVVQHPAPGRSGMNAEALLARLFPDPADTSLPEYQQYQSLLSAQLQAEAKTNAAVKETAARQAADEEAKAVARRNPGTGTGLKTSCDTYAAHPLDKGRVIGVLGVTDDKIVPAQAIAACQQAVKTAPKTARFQFQLGRAYWAAEQYDNALDAMLKAEELGYAPAYFYLGMAYEDGLVDEKGGPNLETARDMYMVAASEGFEPAVAAYQDFEDVPDEAPGDAMDIYTELKKPAMMKALVEGNSAPLVQSPTDSLHYIIGIQSLLIDNDNLLDAALSAKCQALVNSEITAALQTALTREGQNRLDSLKGTGGQVATAFLTGMGAVGANKATEDLGEDDMFFVVGLSDGGCESPVVQNLYKNVKAILSSVTAAAAKSPAGR